MLLGTVPAVDHQRIALPAAMFSPGLAAPQLEVNKREWSVGRLSRLS